MSAGWVAGSVRARALARRGLGAGQARSLAGSASLEAALGALAKTPYGRDIRAGQSLVEAQRAVAATLLWHLRVLAGWVPRAGVRILRAAAGWYELANVDGLLSGAGEPFILGTLATSRTGHTDLHTRLAAFGWDDQGSQDPRAIRIALRLAWLERLAVAAPMARPWAAGVAGVLLAGERFGAGAELTAQVRGRARRLLGPAVDASSLTDMHDLLPASARWALDGVRDPAELWVAAARCATRCEDDGRRLVRSWGFGAEPLLGVVAVLAADAWRVRAALELAARGGGPLEAYDALA